MTHTFAIGEHDALHVASISEVFVTKVDQSGRREIRLVNGDTQIANESKVRSGKIWKASSKTKEDSRSIQLSSMLPLELDLFILGYGEVMSCPGLLFVLIA
jgi:hypothetical protein